MLELFFAAPDKTKLVIDALTAAGGLFIFGLGVWKYFRAVAIRRYEKFHEMSVRFDDNKTIEKVCRFLNGSSHQRPDKQEKEVFICFLEEIQFMVNSGIMEEDLALYSFGHYARLVRKHEPGFWDDLREDYEFYVHFRNFCAKASEHHPKPDAKLVF